MKTKPTQHSVQSCGRSASSPTSCSAGPTARLPRDIKRKIALFCDVARRRSSPPATCRASTRCRSPSPKRASITSARQLTCPTPSATSPSGRSWSAACAQPHGQVTIDVVGKYVGLEDSYKSLTEALFHGGFKHHVKVNIEWVEAEALETRKAAALEAVGRHPGARRLRQSRHARHDPGRRVARTRAHSVLRHLLGFQWATVEFARNVCACTDADRPRSPDTGNKVIYKLRDLQGVDDLGGTMRLGVVRMPAEAGIAHAAAYAADVIHERHRHRYEFNSLYEPLLAEHGHEGGRPVARRQVRRDGRMPGPPVVPRLQFHPEFKSKPRRRTRCSPGSSRPLPAAAGRRRRRHHRDCRHAA